MAPHPILMHTLSGDRTREVDALLLQRQRVAAWNAMQAPNLEYWRRLLARVLTCQVLTRGRWKGTASKAPV